MSDIRNSNAQAPLDNIIYVPSSACIPIWNHSRAIGRNSRYNILILSCNLNAHSQLPRSFCEKILHENFRFYETTRRAREKQNILQRYRFYHRFIKFGLLSYLNKLVKIAKIFEGNFTFGISNWKSHVAIRSIIESTKTQLMRCYRRFVTQRLKFFRIISDNGLFSYFVEFR